MSTRQASRAGVTLTARGAIAVILVATLVGYALDSLTGAGAAIGIVFIAGCVTAALLVNRRDLLSVVVTPPLLFFVGTLIAEAARALGAASPLQNLALGLFTAMSGGAPWLFAGTALVLVITWRRGLRGNVRALREELRGARGPAAGAPVPRPRAGDGAYAPEPEGYFEPRVYGTHRKAASE
ncbi:hypothetical protein HNP84_003738 [Thermocatellispora tengchongensis]|uniref:DUF6542 domain-containing protein n=1 Tax=Thermocatellispora tengchongensis TaxID=1073253 RepID=A0A840P3R9_9ACTN|nr:DUF6542 domain-containing protein [Thermocatellispora tengchongensis]MBB5134012.1 hypothetical protein [Thermocatellispora tengchongensis]